jgi:rhamnogalacturonyl hydrolase YesR
LSWTAGDTATNHDVYFGTNPVPGPNEFRSNTTETTFIPDTLEFGTTYYWRIDEVGPGGTTTGQIWSFTTRSPSDPLWALIEQRLTNSVDLFRTNPAFFDQKYPRSTDANGLWRPAGGGQWASGFWPGSFWYLYEKTEDNFWKNLAVEWTAPLEVHRHRTNDHEAGFIIYRSFGLGHRLTAEPNYVPVLMDATESLLTRFDPDVGCIRSWNSYNYPVITDGIMMLEMVFWAVANGGDPNWYDMAVSHANKTMQNNVRPNGSHWQIVDYDPDTGAVLGKYNKQGYDDNSTWSRGQAWGINGFAMLYRETGDTNYLDTAKKMADYFIDNMPADLVPYWDFNAPNIPDELKDSSAAAIAASGLLELSTFVSNQSDRQRYYDAACDILDSLSSPAYLAADPNMGILLHGTANGTSPSEENDCSLIYGDHFFIEALMRKEQIPAP